MEIKKESHPYYTQWRVMSEWCTENAVGIRGEMTLQSAMELRETDKTKAAAQKKVSEAGTAISPAINEEELRGSSSAAAVERSLL